MPSEETIKICCDSLYKNQELLSNINKNQFEELLRAALCNNYFLLDAIVYQQVDGVTMGFSFGPSLANAFLAHYEQIWLNDCPDEFKPMYFKRYVDDIFVLFRSRHHIEKFDEYLNTKQPNIKFTNEKEVNESLPFLDVLISQSNKGFTTTVYHKATFSRVYSNFNGFSDCNWIRTHSHLVHRGTLNHFVYKLSGCGFESSCSHLNFKFRACFEQGVP